MNEYRITKYDPIRRNSHGHYLHDEWTEFSDVGASVSLEDYERVENAYINAALNFASSWGSTEISVSGLEDYQNRCQFKDGQRIQLSDIPSILRSLLRCEFWCRLEASEGFLHVGRDFYMYAGSTQTSEELLTANHGSGLFIEKIISPYHNEEC